MSNYQPTRRRGSSSKSRVRSASASRDETRDLENEMDTSNGDENVRLGNTPDANREDDEFPKERRVKRRGSNHGTPFPDSPGQQTSIFIRTSKSFDNPATSREIGCILRGFLGGKYMSYTDVPKESEANMFKAFANKFKGPNHRDHEVYRVFRNIASSRIRDILHEAREIAIQESHSNNPLDWRPYKQVWIDDRDWIKLIEY